MRCCKLALARARGEGCEIGLSLNRDMCIAIACAYQAARDQFSLENPLKTMDSCIPPVPTVQNCVNTAVVPVRA